MLDPKRFWAEPAGGTPGEPTSQLEQLQAMYMQLGQQADMPGSEFGDAWPGGPGVTMDQIAAWEKKYRVQLPKLFREVFQQQDGGGVRDSEVIINALGSIQPIDTEMLFEELYEDEFADTGLVFEFGSDGGEGIYLLDYNARGRNGEPAVYVDIRDCGELDKVADSVEKFFGRLLKSSDGPEVHWSETERLAVVARERLDLTEHYHGVPAST